MTFDRLMRVKWRIAPGNHRKMSPADKLIERDTFDDSFSPF